MSVNPNDLRALADWLDAHPHCQQAAHMPSLPLYPLQADGWWALLDELDDFVVTDLHPEYETVEAMPVGAIGITAWIRLTSLASDSVGQS